MFLTDTCGSRRLIFGLAAQLDRNVLFIQELVQHVQYWQERDLLLYLYLFYVAVMWQT